MAASGSGGAAARLYVSVGADVGKAIAGLKSADAQFKKTGASAAAMDAAVSRSNATARGASVAYTGMGTAAATTAKKTDGATKSVSRSATATRKATTDAQAAKGAMTGMGMGATVAQGGMLALAYGLGKSVKAAADFDSGMRNVNSIAGLSEQSFQRLKAQVLDLSGPTAQTPQTLAAGMYQLVSSGFRASEAVTVLKASAIAATAGLTDAETATTAIAGALNAYGLKAKDAQMVSDLLFTTVDKGVLTFNDLAQGLGPVLPFATRLGVDLKQVGAMLSILTIKGVPAAEAMTYTKGAMAQLVKPTTELKKELKQLGVASGAELVQKTGSLQAALEALYKSVGSNDQEFAKLFPDIRGLSAAFSITGENANEAKAMLKEFNVEAGRTQEVFKEQSRGEAFGFKQLAADAKALSVQVGGPLANNLSKVSRVASRGAQSKPGKSVFKWLLADITALPTDIARKFAKIRRIITAGADYPDAAKKGTVIKVDAKDANKKIIDTTKGLGKIPGLVTTKVRVETNADVVARRTRTQLTKSATPIKIKTEFQRGGNANTVVTPQKLKPVKIPVEKPKPFKLSVDASAVKPGVKNAKKQIDMLPFSKKTKITADASGAKSGAEQAKSALNSIPSSKTVTVHIKNVGGGGKKRAMGGRVSASEATTLVGERGPELVSLPQGSQVYTAAATRRMLGEQGVAAYGNGTKSSREKRRRKAEAKRRYIDKWNERISSRSNLQDLKDQKSAVFMDEAGQAGVDLGTAQRHLSEAKKRRGKGRKEAIAQAELEIAQAQKRQQDAQQEAQLKAMEENTAALQAQAEALKDMQKELAERNRVTTATHNINTAELNSAFVAWMSNQLGGRIGESTRTLSPKAAY